MAGEVGNPSFKDLMGMPRRDFDRWYWDNLRELDGQMSVYRSLKEAGAKWVDESVSKTHLDIAGVESLRHFRDNLDAGRFHYNEQLDLERISLLLDRADRRGRRVGSVVFAGEEIAHPDIPSVEVISEYGGGLEEGRRYLRRYDAKPPAKVETEKEEPPKADGSS